MSDVFLRLDKPAIKVLTEISRAERSKDPVARAIVDNGFRQAAIVYARPQDAEQERVLRVETDEPERTIDLFLRTNGVSNATRSLAYV